MKRIAYTFLLFLALSPASGFAQGRFMWGITGGVNIGYRYEIPDPSFSSNEPSYRSGWAPGLHGGIEFGYYNWNAICVTIELEYNQRNYYDNGYRSDQGFLEIPVLLKVPILGKESRLYVLAGTNFGTDGEAFDIGIAAGVGFSAPFSSRTDVYIQTEYVYGFNELVHPVYTYDLAIGAKPYTPYTNYSREIRLQLGILFH